MAEADRTCAMCGESIDVGQAWMQSDRDGAIAIAHAGCVYADAAGPGEPAWWVPSEWGPNE
jgi:hypothetical protein